MPLNQLSICGLRGFSSEWSLDFASPNGSPGSGLTILVGPNGGGKSTVLEALRVASAISGVSFSRGQRNEDAGDRVVIKWSQGNGPTTGAIESVAPGSSSTRRSGRTLDQTYSVPSRRAFSPYFTGVGLSREQVEREQPIPQHRGEPFEQFTARMAGMETEESRKVFDRLLEEISGSPVRWSIDKEDRGQNYIRIENAESSHSSDGMGEGSLSLMVVADALHDSVPGSVIVIDEPELSLHPVHQRRLRRVLSRYAKDRQIVIATHSPYFIDWSDLANGAVVARVHKRSGTSQISVPERAVVDRLARTASDLHNPHTLGITSSEVFFLDDNVLVVEGQEDVLVYRSLAEHLGVELCGDFFGWGAGGADKMPHIVDLLNRLGFQRVLGILDGDKADKAEGLRKAHPTYRFEVIPTGDVRSKPERHIYAKQGLTDESGRLTEEHREFVEELFANVNSYFGN